MVAEMRRRTCGCNADDSRRVRGGYEMRIMHEEHARLCKESGVLEEAVVARPLRAILAAICNSCRATTCDG